MLEDYWAHYAADHPDVEHFEADDFEEDLKQLLGDDYNPEEWKDLT